MTVPWAPSTPSGGRAYSDSNQDHAVLDFLLVSGLSTPSPCLQEEVFHSECRTHHGLRLLPPAGGGWEGGTTWVEPAPILSRSWVSPHLASPRWGEGKD